MEERGSVGRQAVGGQQVIDVMSSSPGLQNDREKWQNTQFIEKE